MKITDKIYVSHVIQVIEGAVSAQHASVHMATVMLHLSMKIAFGTSWKSKK
jgi:hypothetical protein